MKWQLIRNGNFIQDDNFQIVCILPKEVDERTIRLIEKTPQMYEAIQDYLSNIRAGKLPTKRFFNDFNEIMSAIPEPMF